MDMEFPFLNSVIQYEKLEIANTNGAPNYKYSDHKGASRSKINLYCILVYFSW